LGVVRWQHVFRNGSSVAVLIGRCLGLTCVLLGLSICNPGSAALVALVPILGSRLSRFRQTFRSRIPIRATGSQNRVFRQCVGGTLTLAFQVTGTPVLTLTRRPSVMLSRSELGHLTWNVNVSYSSRLAAATMPMSDTRSPTPTNRGGDPDQFRQDNVMAGTVNDLRSTTHTPVNGQAGHDRVADCGERWNRQWPDGVFCPMDTAASTTPDTSKDLDSSARPPVPLWRTVLSTISTSVRSMQLATGGLLFTWDRSGRHSGPLDHPHSPNGGELLRGAVTYAITCRRRTPIPVLSRSPLLLDDGGSSYQTRSSRHRERWLLQLERASINSSPSRARRRH